MGKLSNWFLGLAQRIVIHLDRNQESIKRYLAKDCALSIANTRLVASRAILANCDVRADLPQSSEIDLEYLDTVASRMNALGAIGRPASVYICSDALHAFATQVLPQIQIQFVLVSGDSDLAISPKTLGADFDLLSNHHLLMAWFAQNKDSEHPKLHALPIGLDFHSRWRDAQIWGGGFILPAMQEAELRQISKNSLRWSDRKMVAYCNWGISVDRGDRQECKQKMDSSAYFYQTERLNRTQTWAEQSQYAFVVSPSGAGLDCHRTWEALSLGCVPIVKRSPMTEVFEGLPVIIVDEWSQVNPIFLKEQAGRLRAESFDCSKLLLQYWIEQIHTGGASQVFPPLRCHLDQMKEVAL